MKKVSLITSSGRIEGMYHFSGSSGKRVFLLPNKKNRSESFFLCDIFKKLGFDVLTFNYKLDQKVSSEDNELLVDAVECWNWLNSIKEGSKKSWIVGHKFGGWLAMQLLMRRPEFKRFAIIEPQDHLYDYSFLAPCPCDGIILRSLQQTQNEKFSLSKRVQNQKLVAVEEKTLNSLNNREIFEHLKKYCQKIFLDKYNIQ